MDPRKRTCLKCGELFDSAHAANRICPACQKRNARLPRYSEAAMQKQRGAKRRNGEPLV